MRKWIKVLLIIFLIVVILFVSIYAFVEIRFNYLVEIDKISNCCSCKGNMAMYDVCCDCTETLSFLEKLVRIVGNNK